MKNTVQFDPGIGGLAINLAESINEIYSRLMSFQTIHQKRARFKLCSSKITSYIKNNIAFYLGCLLWAYLLVNDNIDNPKEIEGNIFSELSQEQIQNYDYMMQVNFLENYFESYERDMLYYTGKKILIPDLWKNILSIYSEFLKLNNGFVNTKKTNDIILPDKLKNANFEFDIKKKIEEAIVNKNLEILLNIDNLAL